MRISIVNPNTTASMTEKIAAAAREAAAAGTTIVATTSRDGPESIEGYFDGAMSLPGLLERIAEADRDGADAHIIACFDDTGLDAARSLARAPVIGICEAAASLANLVALRFSVVTTLSRSIPIIEHNLSRYGSGTRCVRVRASEVPVLDLEKPASPARERIADEIDKAVREDAAEAIVLGCAGMAHLAEELSKQFGLPVIEGVGAAVKLAESLVSLDLSTSKVGGWVQPRPKPLGSRSAILVDGAA